MFKLRLLTPIVYAAISSVVVSRCDASTLVIPTQRNSKSKVKDACPDPVCGSRAEMLQEAMKMYKPKKAETLPNLLEIPTELPHREECPVDREELGKGTWDLLHTLAAYYPETPSPSQESYASVLISSLSQLYPCHICAEDFQVYVQENPPDTASRERLMIWVCKLHNSVNAKLGKPERDCDMKYLDERWKFGSKLCRRSDAIAEDHELAL
jgi:FAD-linked sulfhydryl oxidase